MHRFSANVDKIDINPYVEVPDEILQKLQQDAQKQKGPLPVKGTLQGSPFFANVVRYRGKWRLYLNTEMRQAAKVGTGDRVTIEISFDGNIRTVPVPPRFSQALSKNKTAKAAFEKLAPSRQKEILRYLNGLKQAETLERNIQKVLQYLQGERVEGLVAVTRTRRQNPEQD